jgi:hypothetical protein
MYKSAHTNTHTYAFCMLQVIYVRMTISNVSTTDMRLIQMTHKRF